MTTLPRRQFIAVAGAATLLAGVHASAEDKPSNAAMNKIVVGVMGVNGRGYDLAKGFATQPNCEVGYLCDVDSRAIEKATAGVEKLQPRKPTGVADFRKMLDDASIDVLVVAAPDHWHAPATILGCSAKKHVYVEKPCSHNPHEGELAVEAARKNMRVVTMGNQRRSWPAIMEAMAKLKEGVIGPVLFSRAWYNNRRGPMAQGKAGPAPAWLDWTMWQGPAPPREFRDNYLHYNWHWFWNWGTGEIGNNGIHALDLSRWGLEVSYPTKVTSTGGRYFHKDEQETPDTHVVSYEFGGKSIVWEGLSCQARGPEGTMFGASFHGPGGTLVIDDPGYKLYDEKNKLVSEKSGTAGDATHQADFLACIRNGGSPHSDIEGAHQSTLLCHLGNIAQRTGHTLKCDPTNGHIIDDPQANGFWTRQYAKGWEPKV